MPRTKSKKRTNKRQTVSNILVSVQKMEIDFMQAPSKLAAKLDKEINAHKKQEKKLTKVLNKITSQMNSAEARLEAADGKANFTRAGKKRLKAVKKMYSAALEAHTQASKQLQTVADTVASLLDKQSKFVALDKCLSIFDKEWVKAAKNAKVKAKPQAKPQAKKTKAKFKTKDQHLANNIEQLHIQPIDHTADESAFDEVAELAS
jgi:hypothetical protein